MIIRGEQRRLASKRTPAQITQWQTPDASVVWLRMAFIARTKSCHHLGMSSWILVMGFRPEAFSLDFCHVKFWRGCLSFLLKRRQPISDGRTRGR